MKRFLLPQPPDREGIVRLSGGDFHYLVRVRRLRPGAVFPALLPGGEAARVLVQSLEGDRLTGEVLPEGPPAAAADAGPVGAGGAAADAGGAAAGSGGNAAPEGLPPLALFQALPKGAKLDLVVRQAAEGAVSEIVPFQAEYSAPRLREGGGGDRRLARWQRIIREARQQSGSAVPTVIRPPLSFGALLDYWEALREKYPGAAGILLHQTPLAEGSFHRYLDPVPPFAALAVGPEGGFSPAEAGRFLAAGFKPLVMGHSILRVETAALYGMAALRIILLESASWILNVPPRENGSSS
ncbi:MAG: 16S rRNA (uracil(1498)-N(3))-methyltransferase [Treponema sp.]|jgi:16S rRNA (uracil1498-N3)-methyltransferase|nr:16S rRNA (uracil(1498)-N(3))-methyltransferase [Treponema sp.]